ncbi:hypothetical protein FR773_20960 [Leclercia adecarboxylata]|nr:hypothetical protein EXN74_04720 [Leclercia adecarboxylata]QEY57155.1 hypothetical protein FTX45_21140 [Leclercia adecarboxylata]QFH51856.1 hypothetical protein FR819_22360 [Leclercia adecarboxylata]QFH67014.1 hypothetical protein FR773_20960 [Leclercia adecarboxylata]
MFVQVQCSLCPSPRGRGLVRHQTTLFYWVVYVLAAGKRHYVSCITQNCFFDVTKIHFLC